MGPGRLSRCPRPFEPIRQPHVDPSGTARAASAVQGPDRSTRPRGPPASAADGMESPELDASERLPVRSPTQGGPGHAALPRTTRRRRADSPS